MQETEAEKIARALSAGEEEVARYIHDPSPRVVRALLANRRVSEKDVLTVANRRDVPADVLELIAKDKRWSESYPIRLALVKNPRSPLSVSLSIVRYLRVFDLEEITRSHAIPLTFRLKVEGIITEHIPTMPLGNKKTLAKKAQGTILQKLLQDKDQEVVGLCLNNPHLIESYLYKVISRADTSAETIKMIAEHPNWSSRTHIQFSLARNPHTPLSLTVPFLRKMKITDLRELYVDPVLPITIRPFVHRELLSRGEDPRKELVEEVFEIQDDDDAVLNDYENKMGEPGVKITREKQAKKEKRKKKKRKK